MSRPFSKVGCAFAAAVLTAFVAVTVVEGFHSYRLRNWGPLKGAAGIQFDRQLGWAPVPDYWTPDHGGITVNSVGFRSPEILPAVPTIALIGDSVAFGIGLADDQTPSAYLADLVEPQGLQVQNLGVAGFGPDQTFLRLESSIDLLPDLRWVVFVVCSDNDRRNCACNFAEDKRKPLFVKNDAGIAPTSVPVDPHCARNHLSTSPLGSWVWRLYGLAPTSDWLPRLIGDRCLSDEELDVVIDQLVVAMKELVEERGGRFTAVVIPHRDEVFGPPSEGAWWDETSGPPAEGVWWQETLDRLGVETLDFRAHLVDRGLSAEQVYGDPVHMSVEGSQVLAAFVAAHLR